MARVFHWHLVAKGLEPVRWLFGACEKHGVLHNYKCPQIIKVFIDLPYFEWFFYLFSPGLLIKRRCTLTGRLKASDIEPNLIKPIKKCSFYFFDAKGQSFTISHIRLNLLLNSKSNQKQN